MKKLKTIQEEKIIEHQIKIMKRVFITGQFFLLLGIAINAVYNFFKGDFAMTRPRVYPEFIEKLKPEMAYVSGTILLLAITAFTIKRLRVYSLFTIAITIFLFATSRHIMFLWRDSVNSFKSLWLIAALLLLLANIPQFEKYAKQILFFNIIVAFLYFQYCGLAHFSQSDLVAQMIPSYIPFPTFFTYFTGTTLLLASIGLLIPRIRIWAALLSAVQIFGWLLLLHLYYAIKLGGEQWIGVGETVSFTGICLLLFYFFYSHNNSCYQYFCKTNSMTK